MKDTDSTARDGFELRNPQVRIRRLSPHYSGMYLAQGILFDLAMMNEPELRATGDACQSVIDAALSSRTDVSITIFYSLKKYCEAVLEDLKRDEQE